MIAKEKLVVAKALVPKDYLRGPVFAARPQKGGRMVQIGERVYEIGGFSPLDTEQVSPALDMRHGRACFTMLSFRSSLDGGDTISFSINEFCHRYAASQGGRYARDVRRIITDLLNCYIRVHHPDGSDSTYRIIERVEITRKPPRRKPKAGAVAQKEIWLDQVRMSPEFHSLLLNIAEIAHIRIDVLNALASPLAQAIYTYIPSRAVHHSSRERAFEITLSTLLPQIGQPVPPTKSQRKQVFTQHARTQAGSIISQLDGAETLSHVLRVELAATTDKKDYKLRVWVEPLAGGLSSAGLRQIGREPGKVLAAWLRGGRPEVEFRERLKQTEPLNEYERGLLQSGQIAVPGNEPFLVMAKALLGEVRFHSLLGEAKGVIAEGQAIGNPTGLLFSRLIEAIGTPAK